MAKSRSTAIVLSILLSGLGQIYLGEAFRGVIILAAAIVIAVISSFALPFYLAIIPIIAYYIWQIYDVNSLYNKIRFSPIHGNIICQKCDWPNSKESEFCNKCGNKIQSSCPKCKELNISGVRYCGKCGAELVV